ncbi:hypothetical protein ACFE04_021079 [Oxalis oulophora]
MTIPYCNLSQCVKEGGTCFEKAHGCKMYEFASKNPEFNDLFNHGMTSQKKLITMLLQNMYKDGFKSVATLVDIGGGTGEVVAEIVKEHPHMNSINFDFPHVVSTTPEYNRVTHVGGDMFQEIPKADWILHNWSDEDCIRILKGCKKALPRNGGKIIIVDIIFSPKDGETFEMDVLLDYLCLHVPVGKKGPPSNGRSY